MRTAVRRVIGFLLAAALGSASAESLVFGNFFAGDSGPASVEIATLESIPVEPGQASLSLSVTGLDAFGPGFAVTSLVLVVSDDSNLNISASNPSPGNIFVDFVPDGGFDFPAQAPGLSAVRFDFTRGDPLTDDETFSWSWNDTSLLIYNFFLHVQGSRLVPAGPDNEEYLQPVSLYYIQGPVVITPVPEPETYALMVSGLALLGFATRRRNTYRVGGR